MAQLYLLEIIMAKISFSSDVDMDNLLISASGFTGDFVIEKDQIRKPADGAGPSKREIAIPTKKYVLFPYDPVELDKIIEETPLRLRFSYGKFGEVLGECLVPWAPAFREMVKNSKVNPTEAKPVLSKGGYQILKNEKAIGKVADLQQKLTYVGGSIEVQYQPLKRNDAKIMSYLFKTPKSDSVFVAHKARENEAFDDVFPKDIEIPINPTMMKAKDINKFLCKHHGCPGAIAFKEFELGIVAHPKFESLIKEHQFLHPHSE